MKLTVIVHEAIEGGYWAEVPAIPGCATEGDSWDKLISNLHEAIEGCLSVDRSQLEIDSKSRPSYFSSERLKLNKVAK